ncbi:CocE/NonD family hydrolase [Streptomyces gardneri]|uniref:CocE/NonD family hydrolase n=1 Tax=Streptomyces gardneri TaxID=66892 RepID=UPI00367617BB
MTAALTAPSASADLGYTNSPVDLTMADGTILKGILTKPTTPGPHPGIVMPASWGLPNFEYLAQAHELARDGYVVVSYNERGFWGSEGCVNGGTAEDISDVSDVVDWMIDNAQADPGMIGAAGMSNGGGLSLLGAAHDPRIKAVVAMSSWQDEAASLFPNGTKAKQSVGVLMALAQAVGDPCPELVEGANSPTLTPALQAAYAAASPQTYVDRYNANGTAILLSKNLQDSVFPPNQDVTFYNSLTTPKKLLMQPGDHLTGEFPGLTGLPNVPWDKARDWFDRYLRGIDNGADQEAPVQVKENASISYAGYSTTAAMSRTTKTYGMSKDFFGGRLGEIKQGWSWQIQSGAADTCAGAGTVLISGTLTQFLNWPPGCAVGLTNPQHSAFWQSGIFTETTHIRGAPTVRLNFGQNGGKGSLFLYLYDVGPTGTLGQLITYMPYSYNFAPNSWRNVTIPLRTAAYDIPPGHRVGLVIDTKDPMFYDTNVSGSSVTFTSPLSSPSTVTLPIE